MMDQRIRREMDALELLGSWGMQRPDDDADGYDIDDGEPLATDPVSDVCRWDREVIEIWREHGGIPLDRSTVEYAWTLIRKLVAENDRLLAELAEPCNCDDTPDRRRPMSGSGEIVAVAGINRPHPEADQ